MKCPALIASLPGNFACFIAIFFRSHSWFLGLKTLRAGGFPVAYSAKWLDPHEVVVLDDLVSPNVTHARAPQGTGDASQIKEKLLFPRDYWIIAGNATNLGSSLAKNVIILFLSITPFQKFHNRKCSFYLLKSPTFAAFSSPSFNRIRPLR